LCEGPTWRWMWWRASTVGIVSLLLEVYNTAPQSGRKAIRAEKSGLKTIRNSGKEIRKIWNSGTQEKPSTGSSRAERGTSQVIANCVRQKNNTCFAAQRKIRTTFIHLFRISGTLERQRRGPIPAWAGAKRRPRNIRAKAGGLKARTITVAKDGAGLQPWRFALEKPEAAPQAGMEPRRWRSG